LLKDLSTLVHAPSSRRTGDSNYIVIQLIQILSLGALAKWIAS
jgi:hypothetical protein